MTWALIGAATCLFVLALATLVVPGRTLRRVSPGLLVRGCMALLLTGLALALIAVLVTA